jgi:putative membrane protein (TIGR04086 family)
MNQERGEGMVSNKKVSGRAMSMPAGICAGVITSVILTLLGAVAVALLLNGQYIEQNQIGYGSMVTLLVASAIGAWFACVRIKHRYLMVCLISGVGYYAALLAISAMFFGGQYQGMGVTLLVILAGSVSVGLIRARPKKTITKGYRKLRTG